ASGSVPERIDTALRLSQANCLILFIGCLGADRRSAEFMAARPIVMVAVNWAVIAPTTSEMAVHDIHFRSRDFCYPRIAIAPPVAGCRPKLGCGRHGGLYCGCADPDPMALAFAASMRADRVGFRHTCSGHHQLHQCRRAAHPYCRRAGCYCL